MNSKDVQTTDFIVFLLLLPRKLYLLCLLQQLHDNLITTRTNISIENTLSALFDLREVTKKEASKLIQESKSRTVHRNIAVQSQIDKRIMLSLCTKSSSCRLIW